MSECIGCGDETSETVPGQIGDLAGVLCADCQVWCDGNIITEEG